MKFKPKITGNASYFLTIDPLPNEQVNNNHSMKCKNNGLKKTNKTGKCY